MKILIEESVLRQALEALDNGKRVRNAEGGTLFQPDLEDSAIAALRSVLDALPISEANFDEKNQ